MSFLAEVATSRPIIRIAAPAPARSPRVVVPVQALPCAEFATIDFWNDNSTPTMQTAGVARIRPRTRRSTSEAPQPLLRVSRAVMKRRETDITFMKSANVDEFVSFRGKKVVLTRSAAIKRPARRNKENIERLLNQACIASYQRTFSAGPPEANSYYSFASRALEHVKGKRQGTMSWPDSDDGTGGVPANFP